MNKLFTKIAALALGMTMATGVGVAVATSSNAAKSAEAAPSTQKWTATSGAIAGKTSGTIENGDYDWSFTRSSVVYTGWSSSCIQLGSKSGAETVTLTNSNYPGTISSVSVECSSYQGAHKIAISVGDTSYLAATATPSWTTVDTKTGTGSSSGTITISFTPGSRALYIKSISVTYETAVPTTSVDVSPATVTLAPGETQQLTTTVLPTNTTDTLSYSSNATGVATVSSSGLITAVADGTATITATSGNYSDTCVVTVETPTTPFIAPEKTSTSGYTGCDETIGFTYGNLTGTLGVSTSNANVSAIIQNDDGDSADVVITFNTATASDSYVYLKDGSTTLATITVTSITASSVTITGLPASATLYNNSTLNLGSQITVTATGSMSSDVSWESDDEDVATVSAGVVTPVALGTANITVTSDDYPSATMTCSVTVSEKPLEYVMTYGSTKNTNPTEIKTNDAYHSTYSSVDSDVVAGDFSKIYGISTSQLKCGSGSASAQISFTIPDTSYITSVVVVVAYAGGTSLNVTSSAEGASTENQTIAVGTLTFDDYLATEKSNKVTLASSASGAFYLSSITINYANFTPELHASSTQVEAAVNTSNQSINLTYDYFTPTGYTAVVKSGSSLSAGAVTFNTSSTPHTATFTTGSTTGATVFTITGTGGGKSASVDVTVTVTEVRNLLTLTITTASDATTFKVGDVFDVGSLVITATFDAAPTTVVYSKANDNLGALTFAPAIGYEFLDSDIGTVTSVIAELEVGTGDEYVEYSISVTDKTYATQVTSVTDLWDGQQIYFGASDGSKVNVAHAGGNQLGSQTATVHETKGLCVDDLEHKTPYTVHREQIDGVTYYSFQNGGYYLEASNTSNNYLTRTETLSDNCRYTISISSGEVTMTNKGNSSRPEFRWNSGSSWFSQYQSSSSLDKAIIYAVITYSEETVAGSFEENWLHMSDYNQNLGWCADEEHAYYSKLKPVWAAMGEYEKSAISAEAEARLIAWAAANGDTLDSNMDLVSAGRVSILESAIKSTNAVAIVVIVSVVSVSAIGGYFFLRKKREN